MRLPAAAILVPLLSISARAVTQHARDHAEVGRETSKSRLPGDVVAPISDSILSTDLTGPAVDLQQTVELNGRPGVVVVAPNTGVQVLELSGTTRIAPAPAANREAVRENGGATAHETAARVENALETRGDQAGVEIGRILDGMDLASLPESERAVVLGQAMTLVGDYARHHRLGKAWTPELDVASAHPAVQKLASALSLKAEQAQADHETGLSVLRARFDGMLRSFHHDINNVLAVIMMPFNLVERAVAKTSAPDSTIMKFVGITSRNIGFLSTIARMYLGSLSVSADDPLRKEPHDAAKIVKLIAGMEDVRAAIKDIRLSLHAPESTIMVMADPDALAVVLKNLLENAIKYTPKGGEVSIGMTVHAGSATFYVRDTGIGVRPEDREKIFAGHRTEEGKKQAGGHGVGLGNVKRLVEAMGSRMELDSEPGHGSIFRFSLPLAPQP